MDVMRIACELEGNGALLELLALAPSIQEGWRHDAIMGALEALQEEGSE